VKIEYTYVEPEDRPIKRAEFMSSGYSGCSIDVGEKVVITFNSNNADGVDNVRVFEKADFAELAALVNRINRQIGNEVQP
jgi:hypothetical protein